MMCTLPPAATVAEHSLRESAATGNQVGGHGLLRASWVRVSRRPLHGESDGEGVRRTAWTPCWEAANRSLGPCQCGRLAAPAFGQLQEHTS
jgi:hypothetical protein